MNRRPIIIIFLLFLTPATSLGTAIPVPGSFPTIQEGIIAALDGDTVLVAPGVYTGEGNRDLDFLGKQITVVGSAGANSTIIDCEGLGRGVFFHNGEGPETVLEGFTIRNGLVSEMYPDNNGGGIVCQSYTSPSIIRCNLENNEARSGGGIYCELSSSPLLTEVKLTGNHADWYGGGLYCSHQSSPVLTNCEIRENTCDVDGGAIYCEWNSNFSIEGGEILLNQAPYGSGAAIACLWSASPSISSCNISYNYAIMYGGGIYCKHEASPTVHDCTLMRNTSSSGGGAFAANYSDPVFTECTIAQNHAWVGGGGFYIRDGSTSVSDCEIYGNTAFTGGGIFGFYEANPSFTNCFIRENEAVSGSGVYCSYCPINLTSCIISGNRASEEGGGIYIWEADPLISECTIADNYASLRGGGIYIDNESSVVLKNSLIEGNSTGKNGGGIILMYSSSLQMDFCTIMDNAAMNKGGGVYCLDAALDATSSIVWSNSPEGVFVYSGLASFSYSAVEGGWEGEGNIDEHPQTGAGNYYHLLPGSPCIDTGIEAGCILDLDGDSRPDGDGFDMGADEFVGNSSALILSNYPDSVQIGGYLVYDALIRNGNEWPIAFDSVVQYITGPMSATFPAYYGGEYPLAPGDSIGTTLSMYVSPTAEEGLYSLKMSALWNDFTLAADSFQVEVVPDTGAISYGGCDRGNPARENKSSESEMEIRVK